MKFLISIVAFWAIAVAKPSGVALPLIRTGIVGVPLQTQFHTQDGLGQYAYGYSDGLSAKEEFKTFDGTTRGTYSYVDAEGKVQTVDYAADAGGFRVAATNLPKAIQPQPAPLVVPQQPILPPQPVEDTPEVIQAKAAHFAAVQEAKSRSVAPAPAETLPFKFDPESIPKPVEDTPEVAKAKVEHYAAKKEVELRNMAVGSPVVTGTLLPTVKFVEPTRGFSYGYSAPAVWNSRFLSGPILFFK